MNREIKFRVWDKKSKKMRELDMISFHNSRGCFDHDDSNLPKLITVWGRDCINDKDIILRREEDDFVLMQFTGLYNKNGVEIYFDDLYIDEDGDVFKVMQMECGRYALERLNDGYVDECIDWKCVEIIGNVYQNPELIK